MLADAYAVNNEIRLAIDSLESILELVADPERIMRYEAKLNTLRALKQ